jgi:hypothetical protein
MVARGVDVVLIRFTGRMGWGYGRISGRVEGSFLVILGLRLKMAP